MEETSLTAAELSKTRKFTAFALGAWPRKLAALVAQLILVSMAFAQGASAQDLARISGTISDPAGATVSGADVNVKNNDTGSVRSVATDTAGRFRVFSLPVGEYEVHVHKEGFADEVRAGVHLVVGQDARVDLILQIGQINQEIRVDADAPPVSVTTSDISGLVGEQQVKDLPLNGRSFDLLIPLNPGVVNFTMQKTGGTGVSNSTNGNNFAVSGNRPQQNIFLLNGVEYTGAAENNMQPASTSGELLGVESVREFNVLRDTYGAEYGKRPGGQVVIVTQSGTNRLHGSAYEFLRNNDLDARNYFDPAGGASTPPFRRNQFGAALGGPIQKDKTFVFGNYEGLRQFLSQTSNTFVPALDSRAGTFVAFGSACPAAQQAACALKVQELLNLWPTPNGPELTLPGGGLSGIAQFTGGAPQTIREDFGTLRVDHVFSPKNTLSAIHTVDDGAAVTATPLDPFSTDIANLREQVLSLEETHVFSPTIVNTARLGYSRAAYYFLGNLTPGTPAARVTSFVSNYPTGAVVVGGSTASNPATQLGLAGSNNGTNLDVFRNLFTYADQVTLTHGKHQLSFGAWFQQFQSNENIALSQFGQASFGSINALLGGVVGTFTYDPAPTEMNWRSLFAAWYAEDTIRMSRNLTVSLGFRAESSTGWNEAHGRAANYLFTNGVINSTPSIGRSPFTSNNAKFLAQPRIGVAWSPMGEKTVIRAGLGMYNDLQDALGYRMDQNGPFNPAYAVSAVPVANLPEPLTPVAPGAKPAPGGVQPNLKTPTLISYSLRVQRELTPNTSLSIGYVGSHGYHEIIGMDTNEPAPVLCPNAACPTTFPTGFGALTGTAVPTGTYYTPAACGATLTTCNFNLANPWSWFSLGNSSYNALQLDVNHRFSKGFSLRGVYTWSRAIDDGDSVNATTANNAPALASNPFHLAADKGLATFNAKHVVVINAIYQLPFGHGRAFANNLAGWADRLADGWSVSSIVTVQSGFPFTPQLSYNPSRNGDTKNPVRPFINPVFTGNAVPGTVVEWFNPTAFIAPPNNSGFYGNAARDTLIGPGLTTWDCSLMKEIPIRERLRLQFRAEIFNALNRANFNTPNLIVAVLTPPPAGSTTASTASQINPTAGQITSTSTTSRQIQFGLKLMW